MHVPGANDALDGDKLAHSPSGNGRPMRIYQFDRSHGVHGFPEKPEAALKVSTAPL